MEKNREEQEIEKTETGGIAPDAEETSAPGYQTRIVFFLKDLFEGEIVSFDFIYRKWKACLILLILLFCYIGNRYNCHRKMAEIERLRTRETELRYEATTLSSELTGVSRPSQIEKLFEEKGIDIHSPKTPSYKLKRKSYEE